ncbi:NAD(P)-dependent dehydrogenase, short-chain alcohol dehydrogenase family [Arachidicoccus rhizosphaerae]|uniref:NAD(P)-dependent dehydrogenase, short-chain alcohol dehydrogenase family n=1 Tax=Arachidicoccus rhizosphaerae TaxID=551991 RepID=A0A1H3XFT5_9BACT|nr:SDR family oxidoreductase [Arachidicoccus rhizosphaerae]SDZ97482.1 NAD(P)-dependent dehydrogenase, short-chain alcohol dehydrogenase family [Arachidicoccus rhizosphaerae]
MKLLSNKNAVITGGSDGIGLGIARSFAQNGANLILVGRDRDKLEIAKESLSHYTTEVQTLTADLSDIAQIKPLAEQLLHIYSNIDILVNNAGIGKFLPFSKTDISILDLHLNLNVKAPYLLIQELLPAIMRCKGNIINISSYFSDRMLQGRTTTAYSLTKGAINSLTKSLAFEIGHTGVRVNAIAPGSVETPQFNRNLQSLSGEEQSAFQNMVNAIYPLGKIGNAEDIGKAATFLASEQASWITGTILAVDGGLTTS